MTKTPLTGSIIILREGFLVSAWTQSLRSVIFLSKSLEATLGKEEGVDRWKVLGAGT